MNYGISVDIKNVVMCMMLQEDGHIILWLLMVHSDEPKPHTLRKQIYVCQQFAKLIAVIAKLTSSATLSAPSLQLVRATVHHSMNMTTKNLC